MPLKVSLKSGERIIVNGAIISCDTPVQLVVHNRVNMIMERQILKPDQANTPSRRIYFAIQNAYISDPHEQQYWLERSREYICELAEATASPEVKRTLIQVLQQVDKGAYYPAMRSVRELFEHDDRHIPSEMRG